MSSHSLAHKQLIARLTDNARCRVVERACLIYFADEGKLTWADADRLALDSERTQPSLPGMGGR